MAPAPDASNKGLRRHHDQGSANTELSLSTPVLGRNRPQKLLFVTVAYSAAPTQTGVTVTLDSGAGAAFDCTLFTGTANAQFSVYEPTADIIVLHDDIIKVVAPAGGAGITATVSVYTQEIE